MNLFSAEFLGRLHPLLVHLPIATLVLAAVGALLAVGAWLAV